MYWKYTYNNICLQAVPASPFRRLSLSYPVVRPPAPGPSRRRSSLLESLEALFR